MDDNKSHCFLLLTFLVLFFLPVKSFAQLGGYTDRYSVAQGDTITFYISTQSAGSDSLAINLFKITGNVQFIKTYGTGVDKINAGFQPTPDSSFYYGCNWQPTFRLAVPDTMPPGVYRAEFYISDSIDVNNSNNIIHKSYGILFIVKPKILGNIKNLLLVATNTWQAYNTYGGKSLYVQYPETGGTIDKSQKVSMQRPAALPLGSLGSADFYKYERRFINWTTLNNIPLEFASMYDLDRDSLFLFDKADTVNLYKILFIVGHNEYWTIQERQQCEQFIRNGGKVVILSGNTCWWQVRFEDNGKTMVCYKDAVADKNANNTIADSLLTTNWWRSPVNNPENSFTGVNFKDGGYVNSGPKLPKDQGYGDYAAFNTQFWVYNGTGLGDGDEFGHDDAIVGYETDGTPFHWDSYGLPVVDGYENTPLNYRILGVSPAVPFDSIFIADPSYPYHYPHATLGLYHATNGKGGAVFNGATTDWADALLTEGINQPDPVVEKITMNVINTFTSGNFPPEIVSWSPADPVLRIINGDPEFLSFRNAYAAPQNSVTLSVTVDNYSNNTLNYNWKVNDSSAVSNSNTFTFNNSASSSNHTKTKVSVDVSNGNDPAPSISWNVFDYPLVILNSDSTGVKPNTDFTYKFESFNYYKDKLNYKLLNAPVSLSIDSTGLLSGNFAQADSGVYNFKIIVSGDSSRADTLNFKLTVSNSITSIKNRGNLPDNFYLSQNYPNPFNPSTTIEFKIPESGFVTLKIYDILGREVKTLVNEEKTPGSYKVSFNASIFASGVYFYRLTSGSYTSIKKMVLLK